MGTNYGRGIIKQIEDLTAENRGLREDNKTLRRENRELRDRLETLESRIDRIVAEAVERATTPLLERIAFLEAENERKDREIERLKAQINKDSTNSSKPPGSDGFKKIPNSRESSGKKSGGQPGHKGARLCVPKNLEELVKKGAAEHIVVDMTGGAEKYVSQWEADLKTKVVYTEYRMPAGSAAFVSYGKNVKALSVLLSVDGIVAEGRLSDFFREASNGLLTVSEASIEKFNLEASKNVDIAAIKNSILNSAVLNVDETPMDCGQRLEYDSDVVKIAKGSTFAATIRTHSTATATLYTVNPAKGDEGVAKDGIIPAFCGILAHDHDKKYYKYGDRHAACGAHLSRELKGLSELYKIAWAAKFRNFYVGMNDFKNETEACPPQKLSEFLDAYDRLLIEGDAELSKMKPKSFAFDELRKMLARLRKYKDAYTLFIRDYAAPFTNNLAERDLRPCKTKQKISGCFRTWSGLLCYATLRSFVSTAKKRGDNLLGAIRSLCGVEAGE